MNLRLCPTCRRLFPPGTATCPEHGKSLRDDPLLGMNLGGYQIVGWLGEGLYTAVHPGTEAQVGVRVVSSPSSPGSGAPGPGPQVILGELRSASAKTEGIGVLPIDGG